MSVKIIDYTKNPLNRIGEVAGICYDSDISDKEKNIIRAKECIKSGHGTTMEFVDITLAIDNYSIRVMREIMRSRVGVVFLQQSTRYVNLEEFEYFMPTSIIKEDNSKYEYDKAINDIKSAYKILQDMGIPNEDIANILPLGSNTKVIMKINLRALQTLMSNRLCVRAYNEARKLMNEIKKELSIVDDEWKYISDNLLQPKCILSGKCSEKNCCELINRVK